MFERWTWVQVLALDPDQPGHRPAGPVRRVDVARGVVVAIAGVQDIAPDGPDPVRRLAAAPFDDLPVGHLGVALGQPVDRPGRAVIVRLALGGPGIDMSADAEAQLRILVENLARPALLLGQVCRHEVPVHQGPADQIADPLLCVVSVSGSQLAADVAAEFLQRIGHRALPQIVLDSLVPSRSGDSLSIRLGGRARSGERVRAGTAIRRAGAKKMSTSSPFWKGSRPAGHAAQAGRIEVIDPDSGLARIAIPG